MADSSSSEEEDFDAPTNMFVDVSSDMFVGRQQEMKDLHSQLLRQRIAAISGIGGVGKTTLSCLYAYNNRRAYSKGIFFIDASSLKMLPFHFAEIAGPDILDLTKAGDSIQNKMKLASRWLRANQDYLLIYDSADDPLILDELFSELDNDVRYIPDLENLRGHVLISSRCPDDHFKLRGLQTSVCLEDLTVEDTCQFLWKRVTGEEDIPEDEMVVLKEIAAETLNSRLPLFLEQSGSYIRDKNLSFSEYLEEIKKNRERDPIGSASFGDNRRGLDQRFVSNFDIVDNHNPDSLVLLELAAFCESRRIPLAMFSCGAHILQHWDLELDPRTEGFTEHILENINTTDLEDVKEVMQAYQGGNDIIRKMASTLWDTQLALLPKEILSSREVPYLSVHAVIQEQLRLRLKKNGQLLNVMKNVGTILWRMLTMDDIPLTGKQQVLAHADKCADFISVFGNLKKPEKSILELYVRLRLKTASLFGWYGLFKTSWDLLGEITKVLPESGVDHLWVDYLAMKSRMFVWQIKGKDSLEAAQEGLEYFQRRLDPNSDIELSYLYAVLHKTCHHALIHEFRAFSADDSDVDMHFYEAKHSFENLLRYTSRECEIEYGSLLMHQGEYYMYKAYKLHNKFELYLEYHQANRWLHEAIHCMQPNSNLKQICKVLIIEVETKLRLLTYDEAVSRLDECRQFQEKSLGRNHRFVAWMVEKMADVLEEKGDYDKCLVHLEDKLERQKRIYDGDEGNLFLGETFHKMGRVLLKNLKRDEARSALEEARSYLAKTDEKDTLAEVTSLLKHLQLPLS